MKKTLFLCLAMVIGTNAWGQKRMLRKLKELNYTARLGYSIGGTAPVGIPSTIRSLENYKFKPNMSIGVDVSKHVHGKWGALIGIHLENKDMKTSAKVKNYHMEMIKGGESLEGMFTGGVTTQVRERMITFPLQATLSLGKHVQIKMGPYVSILLEKEFSGDAHDGYIRLGNPTGPRVDLGNDEESKGTYDFSKHMRNLQTGIDVGVDWLFKKRWGAYAELSWGVTGIHHRSFHTIEQTLYPIYGTVGVVYKLK